MIVYILKRLASIALTFTVVSVIVFLMMHAVPGGPFDGNDMPVSDEVKAKLNASLGLDRPLYVQYFKYMWGVLHFDFGVPFQSPGETVLELLGRAWPPSLILGGAGVLIGAPLGILLGMAAALRRNTWGGWGAGKGLGQALFMGAADCGLCNDPAGDLCALYAVGHAGCAEQALCDRAARQRSVRAADHLSACAAQCGAADGDGVPAHVHRHRHGFDLCRGDVPRAGLGGLFRLVDQPA